MKILFLCVANSARSQMAEGLARYLFGKSHQVESAGSNPSGTVHPEAIRAMKQKGIDITNHHSKGIDSLSKTFMNGLDVVITLCAEEICPTGVQAKEKIHWGFEDPASLDKENLSAGFIKTRDLIEVRLKAFGKKLEFNL